ncbi:PREDICTED: PERQ amino acid-rich with GYF domain-containing protein 2 isoform X2 [Papilio polytes]|uniref:PERQ amino acid-rich with GYF domain-containing protein 2 isoform X2 n=1 Tax=Papilio polytes TaxID=76194 RepID=UPI00067673C2|nr:PREDICTED: PERQ amino acid-rich with GYF domain-containing protein 2 isoform X2 [Papilio polytes]
MGDRNNPIKFGPAWMRNFGQISPSGGAASNNQNPTNSRVVTTTAPNGSIAPTGSASYSEATNAQGQSEEGAAQASAIPSTTPTTNAGTPVNNELILAEMRYGREEMLALYERTTEAPEQLKYFDQLYQQRRKPPVALNNTFQEEMQRENTRGAKPATTSRNLNRASPNENRRTRTPFPRNASSGKRVNNNTNWRQHSREEDEWRSRNRPNAERDWGERPVQGKQSTWNANRSGWVGAEANNEESLPEWAVENAVGRTGTFDSTGAFHGYSNDDTNLPKTTEPSSSFPLVRSLTHGSLSHNTKTPANGFEEWWASDKAKKLSPNKFEANDVKFKQALNMGPSDDNIPTKISKEENRQEECNVKAEEADRSETPQASTSAPKDEETANFSDDKKEASLKTKFVESKTFDALMRSDINLEKVTNDRGNFQSVLITTNNTLRQKHQNIVASNDNTQRQPGMPILQRMHSLANEDEANSTSKNLVEEMFNLSVDDSKPSTSSTTSTNANTSGNPTDLQVPTQMPSSSVPISPRLSMGGVQTGGIQPGGIPAGGMQVGILQVAGIQGIQAGGIQTGGMQGGNSGNIQGGGLQGGGMQGGGVPAGNMQASGMQGGGMQAGNMQAGGMQAGNMHVGGMQGMQAAGMHYHAGIGRGGYEALGMQPHAMQPGAMHFAGIHPGQLHTSGMQTAQAIQQSLLQQAGLQSAAIQGGMQPGELQSSMLQSGRDANAMQGAIQAMQAARMGSALQNVGVQNQALNTAMGLPTSGNGQVIPMPGVSRPMMQNPIIMGLGADIQQNPSMMSAYHQQSGLSMMGSSNVHNSSLFMGQANNSMQANEMHRMRADLYQTGQQQGPYGSMYGQPPQNMNVLDQWYYEDPQYNVHGPFSSKDMYNWYKAGFFNSNLMIRRACDVNMRRLGSYGPMAFGAPIDLLPPYPGQGGYDRRSHGQHELLNQKGLGLEESLWRQSAQSPEMLWMPQSVDATNESRVNNLPMQFWDTEPSALTSKSLLPEKIYEKINARDQMPVQLRASQSVNTSQALPSASIKSSGSATSGGSKPKSCSSILEKLIPNLEEIQKILKERWLVTIEPIQIKRTEDNVEPSALTSKSILPEKIDKDVKSEDQVPVQLMPLVNNQSSVSTTSSDSQSEVYPNIHDRATPNLEEIQNLLQIKWLVNVPSSSSKSTEENEELEVKADHVTKEEEPSGDSSNEKQEQQNNNKSVETKALKNTKLENDKLVKGKATKTKTKKIKLGKKDEVVETKAKEDVVKAETKKSDESSLSKNKKEEKQSRKEVDKEGKDIKEGTAMKEEKGSDKGVSKDSKKKENSKGLDVAECIRKEVAADDKKGKKCAEKPVNDKKQQQETQPAVEIVQSAKKTPWSDAASVQTQSANNYSMTLTNIQRLEREKKMEEIKMQQRMIQIIASQQAETIAREKIMQARLHWAKTRPSSNVVPQMIDIQAEARMQAAAESSAAMAHALDDPEALLPPIPNTPWATSGKTDPPAPIGFWDAHPNGKAGDKPQESQKGEETNTPTKKKAPTPVNTQKEESPAVLEFDSWCKNVLMTWDKAVDVSTFVSFLKDIESPYDVKDYVKFYLGESKDANDFARHFLEKRSKLLRVGTVTPSDDLCSPAMAINPRMSLSGYQELKGKGKKAKKNKMLKVDSRILGFSVTAAEDRINVGDIDTA